MANLDNSQTIIDEANFLFTEGELQELKDWYNYALKGEWSYVIFTGRSYMTALIMEIITNNKMQDGVSIFLTDSSLLLQCNELADKYREHNVFPKILICDDIMMHGRGTNQLVEELFERLLVILGNEFPRDEIRDNLVKALYFHVYMRSENTPILSGAYLWQLHYLRKESIDSCHQTSNDISALILRSNIANTCPVYTEFLSSEQMDKIRSTMEEDGFICTSYQNIVQYTKLYYLGHTNNVKAIMSLRIIKNDYGEGYRVVPFAILPALDADETDELFNLIIDRIPEKYKKLLYDWKEIGGMRNFNELMTLLLSDAILKSFNEKYEIITNPNDRENELVRLARNYNQGGFKQTLEMLEELIGDKSILSMEDIIEFVNTKIPNSKILIELEDKGEDDIGEMEKQTIKERLEDYFYRYGHAEEKSAYNLMKQLVSPKELRTKRWRCESSLALNELNKGLSRSESMYCIAILLQMVDANICNITSSPAYNEKVCGFAQFMKTGELALITLPLRFSEYLPVLTRMYLECERSHENLEDEIRKYGLWASWTEDYINALVEFVSILKQIGHEPYDWNGNYIDKIDKNEKGLYEALKNSVVLREQYINYKNKNNISQSKRLI